jgi:hypothetical protein
MPVRRVSGKVGVILAGCFAGAAAAFATGAYIYSGPDASTRSEMPAEMRARVAASPSEASVAVEWDGITITRSPTVERVVRERAGPAPRRHKLAALETSVPAGPPAGILPRFVESSVEDNTLPRRPTREQVARTMARIRRHVQRCYDTGMVPGPVVLHLTVEGASGKVVESRVSGTSSTATCIQTLARDLRFPRFARDRITITYPYNFR